MTSKFSNLLIGSTGFAATSATDTVLETITNQPPNDLLDAILKVIIAIVTLFGLLKKNKDKK